MADEEEEQEIAEESDEETDTTESEVDVEALKAQAAKADEYKKYADRVTAENKKLKQSQGTDALQNNGTSSDDNQWRERIELKVEGYKEDEVEFILQNGGRDSLDNPLVKAAINTVRKQQASLNATPSGTNKSPGYGKYTEKDLRNMSLEEIEKIVPRE